MPKDLQNLNSLSDRFTPVPSVANASRAKLYTAEELAGHDIHSPLADFEREYLDACQKLEQLIERRQRASQETDDVAGMHHELSLIGSRIQRDPGDPAHEEDYLSVLRRVKESLWRKREAEELKGEFQKLHFELLSLGHKLGYDRPAPARSESATFPSESHDDMNLGDVERQIAELQAQIRSLHDHR